MSVDISHNELRTPTARVLGTLLGDASCRLRELDIGWNAFKCDGAQYVGEGLAANDTLVSLRFAWNSLGDLGGHRIARGLWSNTTLHELDLSYNRLGHKSAFILSFLTRIHRLVLSGNPIGEQGLYCLMPSLAHLHRLEINDCQLQAQFDPTLALKHEKPPPPPPKEKAAAAKPGMTTEKGKPGAGRAAAATPSGAAASAASAAQLPVRNVLIMLQPTGKYELVLHDVASEYERLVAHTLIEWARASPPHGEILECFLDRTAVPLPLTRDWVLPSEGRLLLRYIGKKRPPRAAAPEALFVSLDRMLAMEDEFAELVRLAMIQAVTRCFFFELPQLHALLIHFKDLAMRAAAMRTLALALDCPDATCTLLQHAPRELRHALRGSLEKVVDFQPLNPTGRYECQLADDVDRYIFHKLVDIAREETAQRCLYVNALWWCTCPCARCKKGDTSELGNAQLHFRNVTLNGRPVALPIDYQEPRDGILRFDFVSSVMAPQLSHPRFGSSIAHSARAAVQLLDASRFSSFTAALAEHTYGHDFSHRQRTLKIFSAAHYFTAQQVADLIAAEADPNLKIEIAVVFFRRVVDIERLSVVRRQLGQQMWAEVMRRVGWLNGWDQDRPAGSFELDLSHREHHCVAHALVLLCMKEPGRKWLHATYDGRPMIQPVLWNQNVPEKGVLRMQYPEPEDLVRT